MGGKRLHATSPLITMTTRTAATEANAKATAAAAAEAAAIDISFLSNADEARDLCKELGVQIRGILFVFDLATNAQSKRK